MCYACVRPQSHCVCNLVEPFRAHCDILILQHPAERRKYYSTSKLVTRAIANSKLLRGIIFDEATLVSSFAGRKAYLLYPGPGAMDCTELPLDNNSVIVAIDGTWSEAGKIVHRNPLLLDLPRVSFSAPILSTYRIRKQPRAHCLSTLESIGHLLKLSASAMGQPDLCDIYNSLFHGFDQMVERQLSYWPQRSPVLGIMEASEGAAIEQMAPSSPEVPTI